MKRTRATTITAVAVAGLTVTGAVPGSVSAEPASTFTIHEEVASSEPYLGPCDGSPGTLTLDAALVRHVTVTGSTYNEKVTLHGDFVFEPDDDELSTLSGHFVDRLSWNVSFGQLKDARQRLMTRAVGVNEDGERIPVVVTTVTHFGADGSVEVIVDDVRCNL